jgi:membrane protein YdbS with pleckstrin-like domain
MDVVSFRPSRWLLACWVVGSGLLAAAIGKAAAGVCTVTAFPVGRGFFLAFGATWLVAALAAAAHFLSMRYTLEGGYVTKAAGVLWRHRRSIPLDKLSSVDVRQGPLERLLRMGQIWIFTPASGSDLPEERLIGVHNPLAVKEAIVRAAQEELQRHATALLRETCEVRKLLAGMHQRLTRLEQYLVPASAACGDDAVDETPESAGAADPQPAAAPPGSAGTGPDAGAVPP